jgi:hypothetical protein
MINMALLYLQVYNIGIFAIPDARSLKVKKANR